MDRRIFLKKRSSHGPPAFVELANENIVAQLDSATEFLEGHEPETNDPCRQIYIYMVNQRAPNAPAIHRATQAAIAAQNQRINEFLEQPQNAALNIGPVARRHWARRNARLPPADITNVPATATMRQARFIDREIATHNAQKEAQQAIRASEFVDIEVKINGHQTILPLNIQSLRTALGLPPINLLGLTEFDAAPEFNPNDDMVDVDHAEQQDAV
jgi:hypothetical protein